VGIVKRIRREERYLNVKSGEFLSDRKGVENSADLPTDEKLTQ